MLPQEKSEPIFQGVYEYKGKEYFKLAVAWDKTHDCQSVVYCPNDCEHTIYVRSMEDWERRFRRVRG